MTRGVQSPNLVKKFYFHLKWVGMWLVLIGWRFTSINVDQSRSFIKGVITSMIKCGRWTLMDMYHHLECLIVIEWWSLHDVQRSRNDMTSFMRCISDLTAAT